jgi:23S rRNA (cytosine1962-C5)-methyltransferase
MNPALRISRRAADRLRAGHLWVYRSELLDGADQDTAPAAAALVTVQDNVGRPLGAALYSSSSQIALRVVSRTPDLSRAHYLDDVQTRIAQAIARRRTVAPLDAGTDAQRLIFAEADNLPGIIADRYADLVIVQLLTQGTAQDDVRAVLVEALRTALSPNGEPLTLWERPDPRIRELEQLLPPAEGPLFTNAGAPAQTLCSLNGLCYSFDAAAGQKTGAFLDQRLNYIAAAEWVRRSGRTGHALDVCTYHGGFALHLARVCDRVTGVDQSRTALEAADHNLERNRDLCGEVDWIEADAFELLRALDEASRASATRGSARGRVPGDLPAKFDAIVLDPPAFAKSRRAAEGAVRGYKELNLRALRLLAPGGTLITCSCSHHVSLLDFTTALADAASDAGRRVQLLETRAAAPDHPEVLTLPETRYLKCLICRVD